MDYLKKRDKELLIDNNLDFWKDEYEETGNPICVWMAITFLRNDSRPIKPWIKKYLVETAKKLASIENPKTETDPLIKAALGIKDGRQFTEIRRSWKADEVHAYIKAKQAKAQKKGKDRDSAYEKAANKFNISEALVKKYYAEGNKKKK